MRSALLSLFTFTILLGCQQKETEDTLPNIVYFIADDLGYGDLSCLGQEKFSTPNIDRLARDGMLFTQHYSGSTVCAPSRSALMTGQHTGHTPIRGNKSVVPRVNGPYPMQLSRSLNYSSRKAMLPAGLVSGDSGDRERRVILFSRDSMCSLAIIAREKHIIITQDIYGTTLTRSFCMRMKEARRAFMGPT